MAVIPEGFIPIEDYEKKPPEGFIPIEEAREQGAISTTRAADIPMIGDYEELNRVFTGDVGRAIATSFLISFSDDEETSKIMGNTFPGSKILKDEEGGTIFVSPEGKEFAIDRPGLDPQDIIRGISEVAGFAIAPGRSILAAGVQAGIKQTAIESVQEASGGDFEAGDIGATAVGAGAGQFVSGLLGRGINSLREGAEGIVKQGKELGAEVLTSDVIDPETGSAVVRFMTRIADKYPGIGTAANRAEQRKIRGQLGEDLAREFNITDDLTSYPRAVTEAIEQIHAGNIGKASKMRKDAMELISIGTETRPSKVPINKTLNNISDQIDELERLGMKSDAPVIANLTDTMETLPKAANFEELAFVRTRMIRAIKEAERGSNPAFPFESAARLKRIKSSLDNDMQKHADSISKKAGDKWRKSNQLFADEYSAYDKTILAKIASEGDMGAEKLTKTLASTNVKDLKQLYNQLDDAGRTNAKAAVIQNMLDKSGYFIDDFKPHKLANQIDKPAVKVFFKGKEKKELDGLVRYIRATKEADIAKDFSTTGSVYSELLLSPVSILGKMYQSKLVRDLFMKLAKTNPKSKKGEELIGKIRNHIYSVADEITAASAVATPGAIAEVLE